MKTCAELDGKVPGRSGLDSNPITPESSGRGRILKMRLGVNPNSSGHGVLFGSMFFIPYSVLSSLVANAVVSGLDEALVSYRDARSKPSPADRGLSVAVWTLAWAGFAGVWAAFLSTMILYGVPIWSRVLLAAVAALPIAFLAYRAAVNPAVVLLAKRCPKPCLWGLALGVFAIPMFGGLSSMTYDILGAVLLYAYAAPLAFVLTAGAARAAGVLRRAKDLSAAAIAYVVVGLLLVIPIPPISRTGYNPVGLFFPFWGFGVPWAVAMWSLVSFAPLLMSSSVSRRRLEELGAYGCIAGDLLATVDPDGFVHPCSHLDVTVGRVEDLPSLWTDRSLWSAFRDRDSRLTGKCSRCGVRDLCRGGCAVVNAYYGLGLDQPDPELTCGLRVVPH
ncbi:MAG: SPASM domain-containing protein [Bacillota bacterium]|jgi:radical SAM protein with 4Fe4S-binding SPASM domain